VRALARRPVELADHERAARRLGEVAWTEVGGAPLDDPGDQAVGADEPGDPVLHEAVAERDEGLGIHGRQRRFVMRGLHRHQREVEPLARRLRDRLDLDRALLPQLVEAQALVEPCDVVGVGIEHHHPLHGAGELGGGHAADRAAAHDEHRGVDHPSSSSSLARAA
jgi:hypothetical protein